MAHFYGELRGCWGLASRIGGKRSGLCTTAASWAGAVRVVVHHEAADNRDYYTVSLIPWHGSGPSRVLAQGVLGEETPVEQPCPLPAAPGVSLSEVKAFAKRDRAKRKAGRLPVQ